MLSENLRVCMPTNQRAVLTRLGRADDLQGNRCYPSFKANIVDLLIAPYRHFQPIGCRVHARHAYTVQPTRNLVGSALELSSRMKPSESQFHPGHVVLSVNVYREATAVVSHGDGTIRVKGYINAVAVARQRLINRVIAYLHEKMMKPLRIGTPDVHGRATANGL